AQVRQRELAGRPLAGPRHRLQLPLAGGRELRGGEECLGGLPTHLDGAAEPLLVRLGEELVLADLVQVQANEVFLCVVVTLLLHPCPAGCDPWSEARATGPASLPG